MIRAKRKRIFRSLTALLLSALLLLPMTASEGLFSPFDRPKDNPFASWDTNRTAYLNGSAALTFPSQMPAANDSAFLVGFPQDVSLDSIYALLSPFSFSLLSYSAQRSFLVWAPTEAALQKAFGSSVSYIVPDSATAVLAENEAESDYHWELEEIGAEEAWKSTTGSSRIVVAIIDSGIAREHAFFAGHTLLNGYDIIDSTSPNLVSVDLNGHGTKVAGAILSVAPDTAILPIRVWENGVLKTSNIVKALYLAADTGSKIINMSYGNYTANAAEQAACAYAVSTGCILIAASGNEGTKAEAGQYSYPASYDDVISVGSADMDGTASNFSQYNDRVDVIAPGRKLYLPLYNNGESIYVPDNGTSFSCAYVSAAAALTLAASKRALTSAEFEKLLEYSSGEKRTDSRGYGMLNLPKLLAAASQPILLGVSDGAAYFSAVSVSFTRGSATLDGEPYTAGDSIFSNGEHAIVLTDEYGTRTVTFYVDTVPLRYQLVSDDEAASIVFTRGTATLDGLPYDSGEPILIDGEHSFVLTGPYGNVLSETVAISRSIPSYTGVENGKTYNNYLTIRIIGLGKAYLDGTEFTDSITVTESGAHTLRLTNTVGTTERVISFRIETPASEIIETSMQNAHLVVSETTELAAMYSDSSRALRIATTSNLSGIVRLYTTSSAIVRVFAADGQLIVVMRNGCTVLDQAKILSGSSAVINDFTSVNNFTDAALLGGKLFLISSGVLYSLTPGESDLTQAALVPNADSLCANPDDNQLYLYNSLAAGEITVFYPNDSTTRSISLSPAPETGSRWLYSSRKLCCGTGLYSAETFRLIGQLPYNDTALYFDGSIIAGKRYVFSTTSLRPIGQRTDEIYSFSATEQRYYAVTSSGEVFDNARADAFNASTLGLAPVSDDVFGSYSADGAYTATRYLYNGFPITDLAYDEASDRLYVLIALTCSYYVLNPSTFAVQERVNLNYIPNGLEQTSDGVYILFEDAHAVYSCSSRTYTELSGTVSSLAADHTTLYYLSHSALTTYQKDTGAIAQPLPGMEIYDLALWQDTLFLFSSNGISSCSKTDFSVRNTNTYSFKGALDVEDGRLIAGPYLLNTENLSFLTSAGEQIFTVHGNAAVTASGLFSVSEETYLESTVSGALFAAFDRDYNCFLAYSGRLVRIAGGGRDVSLPATVTGVTSEGVYPNDVTVTYDKGIGYLDNLKFSSGSIVSAGGVHTLTLLLPWGIEQKLTFTIHPTITGIDFHLKTNRLNVGEVISINAALLPSGSTGGKILYSTDSNTISVTADGVVTALREGSATVRAQVEGTEITATAEFIITNEKLIPLYSAYIRNVSTGVLSGVSAETDVALFLSRFDSTGGKILLYTADERPITSGIVPTGSVVKKCNESGFVIDECSVSVLGDVDGDGRITVADTELFYQVLRGDRNFDDTRTASADLNGNGKLTIADLKLLRNLAVSEGSGSGAPLSEASFQLYAPLFAFTGDTFYVTLRRGDLGDIGALTGTLQYDPSRLTLAKVDSFFPETTYTSSDGAVRFSLLGLDDTPGEERLLRVFFTVRAPASDGSFTLKVNDISASADGVLVRLSDVNSVIGVRDDPSDALMISSSNASFNFLPDTYEYTVSIAPGETHLALNFACPRSSYLYFDDKTIAAEGSTTLSVTYVSPTGEIRLYQFFVTHDEPRDDSSALSSLQATVPLAPDFDPSVYYYTATVPYETEQVKITASGASESTVVTLSGAPTLAIGQNIYRVTCQSESGESRVYTIAITRASPPETSEISDEPSEPAVSEEPEESEESINSSSASSDTSGSTSSDGFRALPVILILCGVLAAAAIIFLLIRRRRVRDGSGREDSSDGYGKT